jgi:hypothetical protein
MSVCRHRCIILLVAALMGISSPFALAAQTKSKSQKNTNTAKTAAQSKTTGKSPASTAKAKPKTPVKSAGATLFVVSQDRGGSHIEPLVGLIEGRYLEPPAAESEQFSAFASRYYRTGQKYRVLFGGGDAGTATVRAKADKDSECARGQASVELQSSARISGLVMGLATNSETMGRHPISRRFPTQAERTAVIDLAGRVFRQKGVSAAAVQDMKTINMTATDLNGDGKWEIVASFTVRTHARTAAVHHLFLVAVAEGGSFDVDLVRYARTTKGDIPEGASLDDVDDALLSEVLVDHVDLDGDKRSEIVTMTTNFEGATYKIYRKQKTQWANIYEYYSYHCAY